MEAKTPQNHSNLPRIDIPGKNDLEILENLKTIIKSNQHDLYKPIPQPEALLSQYYGPLPHTSNHTSHDASPPRTRRPSAFDTPLLHQNTTPSVSASSGEPVPQPMNDSRRASLVHDLPARPGQQQRQEPSPSANGLTQPRNGVENRRNEVLPGNRQLDTHYTPPQSSAQEHYPRDREERSSYERPRETHNRDDRERSPGVWDARRPPTADFRERRDDRRTFQPRPPPEDRHYEPSPERSAALEAARRPPDELERARYADNFYASRGRRPSDGGGRVRPEDRSYRPVDNGSRLSAYPAPANEPYTPPNNRDAPPPRSASVYDRDPVTPATRSLEKPISQPAPPSLEARLNPPPARPSLQDRIGPPFTPNAAACHFSQNPNSAGSKPAPSLEQRLAMPPPSSTARSAVSQQSPSVSTTSPSSTLRPSYSGTHYSPSSARDPASTGQEHRSTGERLPERYNRSPPPRETIAPRPASAHPVSTREESRNIVIKREPSPHGALASSATFRGSSYRPGENDGRTNNGTAPSARREAADADRYEPGAPSAPHGKPQHPVDSRDAERSGRYSQPPAARSSPAPPSASTAPPSTSNNNFAERRSLALSREMQDALYKPPQHFTPIPNNKDADRRRETYPADESYRPKPTLTERERDTSAPRSSYPPMDERERMPVYREAPPRAVYESQAPRPLSARLADPYPLDERDRSYHPPSSANLPPPDARDYERSRYPPARPLDSLPPPNQAMYPPSTRVRQRSPSPILDSRRGGVDMRAPPMKRPRDDLYASQQQGPPPSSSSSSYYPPPPQRDYRDGPSSYYPVDNGRDLRPREVDYAYDTRGRAGDGYAPPRYTEDDRDRRYMPPPRTS